MRYRRIRNLLNLGVLQVGKESLSTVFFWIDLSFIDNQIEQRIYTLNLPRNFDLYKTSHRCQKTSRLVKVLILIW